VTDPSGGGGASGAASAMPPSVPHDVRQLPAHATYPFPQVKPQWPDAQVATPFAGALQAVPQSPQCDGSLLTSTHDPPQFVSGRAQWLAHLPAEQTWFAAHAVSHVPQWSWSLASAVSQPSVAFALQSPYPALQLATAHALSAHSGTAWATVHALHPFAVHPYAGSPWETHAPLHDFSVTPHPAASPLLETASGRALSGRSPDELSGALASFATKSFEEEPLQAAKPRKSEAAAKTRFVGR
jgi:hypothetical protein